MKIFGFEIRKANEDVYSFVTPTDDSGSSEQVTSSGASYYGVTLDLDKKPKNDVELINKYRTMQMIPEVDAAIEDIICEMVVVEEDKAPVSINILAEEEEIPKEVQQIIVDEFDNVMGILKFNERGHDFARTWYIDGRIYFHILADEKNLAQGIKDLRYIDPRKIKPVKLIQKEKTPTGIDVVKSVEEFYLFNDNGIAATTDTGVKLSKDVIAYVPSGLIDEYNNVISHLHKAIKPANQLRYMEDATLIYRISRAPERRIFYIDVQDMPKQKAEQYVKDIMNRYRNKIVYDSKTGEIRDDRQHFSMLEDFWMPRRSNGSTTQIDTLEGGANLGEMDDVLYFHEKMLMSLNVPISRLKPDQGFTLGRSQEISREEIKFSKFIARLRRKFSHLFLQLLRVQLILKGVIAPEDWDFISSKIQFDFTRDNFFAELKDNEILAQRLAMMQQIEPLVGVYFSQDYVSRQILRMTTEQIMKEQEKIAKEMSNQTFDEEGNPIKQKRVNQTANKEDGE